MSSDFCKKTSIFVVFVKKPIIYRKFVREVIFINVYSKRPLFASCSLFLLTSLAAFFVSPTVKFIIIGISALVLTLTLITFIFKKLSTYPTLYISLCSAMIIIATLISYIYFDTIGKSFDKYDGEECVIDAVVISDNNLGEGYSSHVISVNSVNGEKTYHKAKFDCQYLSVLSPGFRFTAKVTATSAFENDPGMYNERNDNLADGIFISYTSFDENTVVITDEKVADIRVIAPKINSKLSAVLKEHIDGEAGRFASALLLGNRSLLSNETQRDFSRSGVSHILALSGLHVSIILGLLLWLLKSFGVKHKTIAIILIACATSYLAITGFSMSAARAVIMFLILYLSNLYLGNSDSLTALGLAAVILMTVSPGTVVDIGFWMSVSATLGILVYLPSFKKYINNKLLSIPKFKIFFKALAWCINALATGLFALIPLFVVLCFSIKQIQVFGILSSALLSLPTEIILILSIAFIPLHAVPVISTVISEIIKAMFGFMMGYCSAISDMHGIVFSLNYRFTVLFGMIIFAAVVWSLVAKRRNLFVSLIPFAIAISLFCCTAVIYEASIEKYVKVEYINASSKADMLVISNSREAIICDIGNGSNSSYFDVANELYDARVTEIRAVMLTRYAYAYHSSLTDLFSSYKVREVWLPKPINEKEYYHMLSVADDAERYGVDVYVYEDGDSMSLFSHTSLSAFRGKIARSTVPISMISINTRTDRTTYLSPAYNECEELSGLADEYIQRSNCVIFGNKGPVIKKQFVLPDGRKTDAAIFADRTIAAYYGSYDKTYVSTYLAEDSFTVNLIK